VRRRIKCAFILSVILIAACAGTASAAWDDPYISATLSIKSMLTESKTVFVAGMSWNKPVAPNVIFNIGMQQVVGGDYKFDPTVTVGFTFRMGRRMGNESKSDQ
jgi:hypothetical protein